MSTILHNQIDLHYYHQTLKFQFLSQRCTRIQQDAAEILLFPQLSHLEDLSAMSSQKVYYLIGVLFSQIRGLDYWETKILHQDNERSALVVQQVFTHVCECTGFSSGRLWDKHWNYFWLQIYPHEWLSQGHHIICNSSDYSIACPSDQMNVIKWAHNSFPQTSLPLI